MKLNLNARSAAYFLSTSKYTQKYESLNYALWLLSWFSLPSGFSYAFDSKMVLMSASLVILLFLLLLFFNNKLLFVFKIHITSMCLKLKYIIHTIMVSYRNEGTSSLFFLFFILACNQHRVKAHSYITCWTNHLLYLVLLVVSAIQIFLMRML